MRKGKRIMLWVIAGVVVLLGLTGIGAVLLDGPGRREITALTFSDIDFDHLRDGVYTGEYVGKKSHLRDAQVEVTVKGGEVRDIQMFKKDGTPMKSQEGMDLDGLLRHAVDAGELDVDVISGATVTSKVYLKAFEDALEKAQFAR